MSPVGSGRHLNAETWIIWHCLWFQHVSTPRRTWANDVFIKNLFKIVQLGDFNPWEFSSQLFGEISHPKISQDFLFKTSRFSTFPWPSRRPFSKRRLPFGGPETSTRREGMVNQAAALFKCHAPRVEIWCFDVLWVCTIQVLRLSTTCQKCLKLHFGFFPKKKSIEAARMFGHDPWCVFSDHSRSFV